MTVVDLSDVAINARARLADALTTLIEADPRVRRWRRMEFAEDGGALVVVQLHGTPGKIAGEVIARELEFELAMRLPALPWIRVQPESNT
jgi:hypothetical protein